MINGTCRQQMREREGCYGDRSSKKRDREMRRMRHAREKMDNEEKIDDDAVRRHGSGA